LASNTIPAKYEFGNYWQFCLFKSVVHGFFHSAAGDGLKNDVDSMGNVA